MNTIDKPLAGEIKPSFIYEGQEYYNRSNAAKYVGMTDEGLRRRMKIIEKENNIVFPLVTLPTSINKRKHEVYIHGKILDLLRKPVIKGKEKEWFEKLKETIQEVQPE